MTKKVLALVTDGSEEMEVVIVVDLLRRAKIDVVILGLELANKEFALCSRNVKIQPDCTDISSLKDFDAIFIPGGAQGSSTLSKNSQALGLVKDFHDNGKYVVAVCAGPLVIKAAGIAKGKKLTSHPSVKEQLTSEFNYQENKVVADEKLITSRGPGTCFSLALTLIKELLNEQEAENICPGLILD